MTEGKKLHIGCGSIYLKGWINIDLETPEADLHHDLTTALPYENDSVDLIYSEHFIEHLSVKDGIFLLKECHRVLKPGGIMRTATPDLDNLIAKYRFGWENQPWIKKYGYDWLQTKAEMLNLCFREWGHQYLYNSEELKRRLKEAGFTKVHQCKLNKSKYPELTNLETREDSKLIIEAIK